MKRHTEKVIISTNLYQFLKSKGLVEVYKERCREAGIKNSDSIESSFDWKNTKEGWQYWNDLYLEFNKYE